MIEIREATAQDMPAVHGLIMELAVYEKEPDAVITTPAALVQHGFVENRFRALVAVDTETSNVVGMALYYPRYSTWKGPTLHLEDFYVQQGYRGRGIGKQLFERVGREAAKQGVGRMEWTVLEWNEPALNFYKKYGAGLDPEWHLGTFSTEQLEQFL